MQHEPVKIFDRIKIPAPLIFLTLVLFFALIGVSNQMDKNQNFEKISKKAILNSYKKFENKSEEGQISKQEKELMNTPEFKRAEEKQKLEDESLKTVKENIKMLNFQVKKQNIITIADKR